MTFPNQALNQSCISCVISMHSIHSIQHSHWICFQTIGSHLHLSKFPTGRPMYNISCLHRPSHIQCIIHPGRPTQSKRVVNGSRSRPACWNHTLSIHISPCPSSRIVLGRLTEYTPLPVQMPPVFMFPTYILCH